MQLRRADRLFRVWLAKTWSGWQSALVIVKPETVIGWHRKRSRLDWTWEIRIRCPDGPTVSQDVRDLIRKMSIANPIGGAPRDAPPVEIDVLVEDWPARPAFGLKKKAFGVKIDVWALFDGGDCLCRKW